MSQPGSGKSSPPKKLRTPNKSLGTDSPKSADIKLEDGIFDLK